MLIVYIYVSEEVVRDRNRLIVDHRDLKRSRGVVRDSIQIDCGP